MKIKKENIIYNLKILFTVITIVIFLVLSFLLQHSPYNDTLKKLIIDFDSYHEKYKILAPILLSILSILSITKDSKYKYILIFNILLISLIPISNILYDKLANPIYIPSVYYYFYSYYDILFLSAGLFTALYCLRKTHIIKFVPYIKYLLIIITSFIYFYTLIFHFNEGSPNIYESTSYPYQEGELTIYFFLPAFALELFDSLIMKKDKFNFTTIIILSSILLVNTLMLCLRMELNPYSQYNENFEWFDYKILWIFRSILIIYFIAISVIKHFKSNKLLKY